MELPTHSLEDTEREQILLLRQTEKPSLPPPTAHSRRPSNRRLLPKAPRHRPIVLDYWDLTKPEISFLVTISALAGFIFGSPSEVDGWLLFYALLGTALSSGGGGVLNHYLERSYDALMRRTAHRPLPAGRISPLGALLWGIGLTGTGIALLFFFTNPLTALLATLTVLLYLFVYTPLKRRTTYNTLIGTIPGALPALGGWAAATGTLGVGGWTLFLVLALWQMPHFLSLAWMYRKDYARAGYAMLPVEDPSGNTTARQTILFTVLLTVASAFPTVVGVTGWVYLVGALLLGLWFLLPTYAFYRSRSTQDARRVLMASILYIPLLVVLIFVDRWV